MKNLLKSITLSGLLILSLTACGNDDSTSTSTNTDTSVSTPENPTPDTPETGSTSPMVDFELYEEYDNLETGIAYAFTSVRGMMEMGYVPNMPLDAEMQEQVFGVSMDLFTDFHGEVPMMNTQADQLLIYYTEENQAEIQEVLENYVSEQLANQSQYPSTLDKLSVAEVFTTGNYVVLNMLSSYPENEASMESADMTAFYQETIAETSAEIKRVLEGGEPNAPFEMEISDMMARPEVEEGGFITPEGGERPEGDMSPQDFENMDATAARPEGEPEGGVEMPMLGEATAGHAPTNSMPSTEVAGGGQTRN